MTYTNLIEKTDALLATMKPLDQDEQMVVLLTDACHTLKRYIDKIETIIKKQNKDHEDDLASTYNKYSMLKWAFTRYAKQVKKHDNKDLYEKTQDVINAWVEPS